MNQPLRFLHITDSHLGNNKGDRLSHIDCDDSLKKVIDLIKNESFDALLITGDIAHYGALNAYERLQTMLIKIKTPIYLLPGNHDDIDVMHQVFGGFENNVELGDWQLILLDSTEGKHDFGQLSTSELQFLETRLQETQAKHSLIALHHPPVDIDSAWMDVMQLKNKQAFFDIIDRFDSPRAIVWGHVHQEFDQQRKGVRLLSSPSTCSQFLPNSAQHQNDTQAAGYRWLQLNSDGSVDTGIVRIA